MLACVQAQLVRPGLALGRDAAGTSPLLYELGYSQGQEAQERNHGTVLHTSLPHSKYPAGKCVFGRYCSAVASLATKSALALGYVLKTGCWTDGVHIWAVAVVGEINLMLHDLLYSALWHVG